VGRLELVRRMSEAEIGDQVMMHDPTAVTDGIEVSPDDQIIGCAEAPISFWSRNALEDGSDEPSSPQLRRLSCRRKTLSPHAIALLIEHVAAATKRTSRPRMSANLSFS
jgi:hypothetical protein